MQSKILVGTGLSQDISLEVLIVRHGSLEVFVVLVVKNLPAKAGDVRGLGSILGLGRSRGEGHGNPLQLPGASHGQRSLVGYSLLGCKELDMTEQLTHTHTHTHTHTQEILLDLFPNHSDN